MYDFYVIYIEKYKENMKITETYYKNHNKIIILSTMDFNFFPPFHIE